eukprot:1143350-Pelagomonas_calceolata.AAC.3
MPVLSICMLVGFYGTPMTTSMVLTQGRQITCSHADDITSWQTKHTANQWQKALVNTWQKILGKKACGHGKQREFVANKAHSRPITKHEFLVQVFHSGSMAYYYGCTQHRD